MKRFMKSKWYKQIMFFLLCLMFSAAKGAGPVKFGLLKYSGGGDWYANPTSLPNLIRFCNKELRMNVDPEPVTIELSGTELFGVPFIHMTGHGNVVFNDLEMDNLRNYLKGGGFLHIDDNYGMDKFIRPQLKKLFPDMELREIPYDHEIFKKPYTFSGGLPKVHEHDNKAPQAFGIFSSGRMLVLYTVECDLGDGWENPEVHKDPESVRLKALQMGANIVQFALGQ